MAEIIWSASALLDLKGIYDFIAKDSPYYAEKHVAKLTEKAYNLTAFPSRGKIVPEMGNPGIREITEGNYRIIYKVSNDESRVEIIRIHHSSKILKR